MTLLPKRARVGGILVFAAAATLVVVACANGTDPADLGPELDGGPTADGNVVNPRDTSTNPGDSAMPVDAGKDTSTPTGSHVVINEVATGTDADANDEFCELYNPTSAPVSLADWEVRYASSGGGAGGAGHKFGAGDTIGAKSFLLLRGSTWTPGVAAGDGQLALFDGAGTGATKIDGVGYGTVGTSGTLKYFEGPNAPSPSANGSVGRKVDGVDTDKNGTDFTAFASPTPGMPN